MHRLPVRKNQLNLALGAMAAAMVLSMSPSMAAPASPHSFIGPLAANTVVASTIPANGDVNPYGVAVVPSTINKLVKGDILVSNFNNAPSPANPGGLQGTGTTLVEISPSGHRTLFARIKASDVPGGVGLSTALVVLDHGWVVVGSVPTSDGTSATIGKGSLIVLNSKGQVRETIRGHGIAGPWDATAKECGGFAEVFVSNVMRGITNGQPSSTTLGDVTRLVLDLRGSEPRLVQSTVIANGLSVHTDPAALVVGPTGLALAPDGTLFIADTVNSRIAAVPNAMWRLGPVDAGAPSATVTSNPALNGPLGLALAPNGDLLAANGGNNYIVELNQHGRLVTERNVDPADPPGGALFGLVTTTSPRAVYYVNDDTNTLNALH